MRNRLARWAAVLEKAREAHGPEIESGRTVISWCSPRRIPKNAYALTVKRPSPLSISRGGAHMAPGRDPGPQV